MEEQSERGRGRGRGRGRRTGRGRETHPYRCTRANASQVVDETAPRRHGRPRRLPLGGNCANPQPPQAETLVTNPMQSAPPNDTVSPIKPCCLKNKGHCENYSNFIESGLPQRVLIFSVNEWVDFPERPKNSLIEAFQNGKSANIVVINGSRYLIDFVNMVLINLEDKTQKSIGWIDKAKNCFFPKFVIDGGVIARTGIEQIIAQYSSGGSNMLMPQNGNNNSIDDVDDETPMVNKVTIVDNGGPSQDVPMSFCIDSLLSQRGEEVDKNSEYYFDVQNSFMSGLGKFVDPGCILGVYQYKPVSFPALAQSLAFQQQVKRIRKFRGHSNVCRAWFGASKQGITNIVLHGFGSCINSLEGISCGNGLYLNSKGNSYLSAKNSKVDENGNQYILLCKVIMGRMEKIKPGSAQWHPSSDAFDSGVDNPLNPKTYVIWASNINLHIIPECIVAFHLSPTCRDYLAGLNTNHDMDGALRFTKKTYLWSDYIVHTLQLPPEAVPFSTKISILKLFAKARGTIPPIGRAILDKQFHDFRCKLIDKDQLLMKMKETVGDQLLAILKNMENK